ncbi:hypothetical protein [Bradyrhizobium acaciae]|uniref:hypothetical protein n=1 Tax=Bradyrhizobium acaciae TaxID=2683706 RepID=UPI001E2DDCFF|nr:hypothetical protein [Bradyrhizobium acaciae]MCC8981128.1 hypothetical protein [Bradyrhizobium acaciae]
MAGKRSNADETSADVRDMPLSWFNAEIKRCLHGYETGGSSQGRKAFFKRLIWTEAEREKNHGIAAPRRRFGR